jgi:hypothetical protein
MRNALGALAWSRCALTYQAGLLLALATTACATPREGDSAIAPENTASTSVAAEEIYRAVLDTLIGPYGVAVIPDSVSGNWNAEGLAASVPPGFEAASSALAGPRQVMTLPPGLSNRTVLVTEASFGVLAHSALTRLHEKFGSNAVLMSLSRLGVSADSTRAVLATDTWRSEDSVLRELLFLARAADGKWQVVKRDQIYTEQ